MNTDFASVWELTHLRLKLIAKTAAVGVTAFAINGCTHLSVVPDRSVSGDPAMALSGTPYALPMLQYDVAVTRTLTACPEQVKISGDTADGQFWRAAVAVELSATATAKQIEGERYLINYSKLDGALKTTNFAIEYQPGTEILKGINVSVEDHSGEVVGNVVKTGLAVAAVVSGPAGAAVIGTGSATLSGITGANKNNFANVIPRTLSLRLAELIDQQGSDNTAKAFESALRQARAEQDALRAQLIAMVRASTVSKQIMTCTTRAAADVVARAKLAEALEADGKKLKAANTALETLTKLAAVRGLTPGGRNNLGEAAEQVLTLGKAVEDGQAALAAIDKRLGVATSATWPESFAAYHTKDIAHLDIDERDKLSRLLAPVPATLLVIDAETLADKLANSTELERFRTIAKEFVSSYVDEDGTAKRFPKASAVAGCSSDAAAPLDAKSCMVNLTTLGAALQPVSTDSLPACPTGEPECRSTLANDVQLERKDFPRQVPGRTTKPQPGLFVRPPVRAQLTICRIAAAGEVANPLGCAASAKNLVKDDKVLAPQLGQLRFYRLVNQMFSNNGLSLSLSKDGVVEKFQYASSKSIAQGLFSATADAAAQVAAFDKQRREEYLKNTDQAAFIQKQIALEEALNKLEALNSDPTPDPMKAVALAKAQAEVELLRAQINSLNAQTIALTASSAMP
ncbi:MAG: hypothetical protein ACKVOP_07445 [Sphingomonadaceae bacterium]